MPDLPSLPGVGALVGLRLLDVPCLSTIYQRNFLCLAFTGLGFLDCWSVHGTFGNYGLAITILPPH